ncbi:MAG: hypothetical protein EP343_04205 [Deltaproteobacteria bacterium]|nr:MAG: hypothetical protein EP343_04205 [Deltaproteobacteria bacterium]
MLSRSLLWIGVLTLGMGVGFHAPSYANPYFTPAKSKPRKAPTTRPKAEAKAKAKTKPKPAKRKAKVVIPKGLQGTILRAIALIDAKKHKETLEWLMPPEELRKVRSVFDRFVEGFAKGHAAHLRTMLQTVLSYSPTIKNNRATFKVKAKPGFPGRMRFERRGTRWYLLDR